MTSRSVAGGLLVRWRRHRRRGEFGVLDGNVLLDRVDLNGETAAGTSERPTERNFHAVGVAVIGVIDLRGIAAERSFGVAHEAKQEAAVFIEVKTERRLALGPPENQIRFVVTDLFAG